MHSRLYFPFDVMNPAEEILLPYDYNNNCFILLSSRLSSSSSHSFWKLFSVYFWVFFLFFVRISKMRLIFFIVCSNKNISLAEIDLFLSHVTLALNFWLFSQNMQRNNERYHNKLQCYWKLLGTGILFPLISQCPALNSVWSVKTNKSLFVSS